MTTTRAAPEKRRLERTWVPADASSVLRDRSRRPGEVKTGLSLSLM